MHRTTRPRHSLIAALSFMVLLPGFARAQADQDTQQPAAPAPQVTPAAEPVPVRIGGDPVIFIPVGLGGFSAQQRATRIEEVLAQVIDDESVAGLPVRIQEVDNTTQLFIGSYRIATVTEPDAQAIGVARVSSPPSGPGSSRTDSPPNGSGIRRRPSFVAPSRPASPR